MKKAWISGFLCLFLLAGAASAGAQEVLLRQDGRVEASALRLQDGTPVQWHSVQPSASTILSIHLVSVDFAPRIVVDIPGRSLEVSDGDGGVATLSLPVNAGQSVRIGVATTGVSESGTYALRVEIGAPAVPIRLGEPASGFLPSAGPAGERPVLFRYRGAAGNAVRIRLESADFDTYLRVFDESGGSAENDDAPDGSTDSELLYHFAESGELSIQAGSWGGYGSGRFTLLVSEVTVESTHTPGRLIGNDEEVSGWLTVIDPQTSGRRSQLYTASVTAGQEINVLLRSSDFDAYLIVESPSGRRFEDDDSGGGLDANVVIVAEEGGIWKIHAGAFDSGSIGEYRLSFRQGTAKQVIHRFSGSLSESGRQMHDRTYQVHTIATEAGRDYQVELRSDDFDTYLMVLDAAGSIVAENDDFGSSTDSRVDFRAAGGTYSILAGAYHGTPAGFYEIDVRR